MLIGVGNSERGNGGSKEDERLQVTGVTEVDQIQVSDTSDTTVASSLAHSITLYQGVYNQNTSKTKNDLEDRLYTWLSDRSDRGPSGERPGQG